jgi:GTP-binding protein
MMPIATIRPVSSALDMAKGGVHGKKTRMLQAAKKKKKSNPTQTGKHRKTSNKRNNNAAGDEGGKKKSKSPSSNTSSSQSSSTRPKLSILGETKKGGPPWQVMGERDMEENVEAEKARRERIKLGLISPSDGSGRSEQQKLKADVTGSNRLLSPADRAMLSWKRFNPATVASSDLTMVGAYLDHNLPFSLGVPEVAFLGRSNVGKSSLLNKLVSRAAGDTARVGKTPGATASVNLYALLEQAKNKGNNDQRRPGGDGGKARPIIGFADLPGFGYAKLSKDTKESVEEAAERYLGKRRELALGVLLVDSRRIPNADDRAVLAALFDMGVPLIVVATKSDKLKPSEVESAMATIREGLGLPDGQPLRVSGVTGEGVRDLWRIILDACETRVNELKVAIEEGRDDGGSMRVIMDEEGESGDFYDDDFDDDEEEDDDEDFEDGDDLFYDQGYDWVQSESFGGTAESYDGDDFYDSFYEGDDEYEGFVSNPNGFKNEVSQMSEKEAFALKNLNKRVDEMERRGEI